MGKSFQRILKTILSKNQGELLLPVHEGSLEISHHISLVLAQFIVAFLIFPGWRTVKKIQITIKLKWIMDIIYGNNPTWFLALAVSSFHFDAQAFPLKIAFEFGTTPCQPM